MLCYVVLTAYPNMPMTHCGGVVGETGETRVRPTDALRAYGYLWLG